MTLYRSTKCPIHAFLYRLTTNRHFTNGSSSQTSRKVCNPFSHTNHSDQCHPGYLTFIRRLNVEISPSEQINLIKQLRERTNAPIKDVKSSLVFCNWDVESAQKDLRKRGVVLATKKSSRTAAEGLLAIAQNEEKAAIIELNCETDFVARNEVFQHLASSLAKITLSVEGSSQKTQETSTVDSDLLENLSINLEHSKLCGQTTVQNAIMEVAAMVGENVKLRRGFTISKHLPGVVSSYLHTSPLPGTTLMLLDENVI